MLIYSGEQLLARAREIAGPVSNTNEAIRLDRVIEGLHNRVLLGRFAEVLSLQFSAFIENQSPSRSENSAENRSRVEHLWREFLRAEGRRKGFGDGTLRTDHSAASIVSSEEFREIIRTGALYFDAAFSATSGNNTRHGVTSHAVQQLYVSWILGLHGEPHAGPEFFQWMAANPERFRLWATFFDEVTGAANAPSWIQRTIVSPLINEF